MAIIALDLGGTMAFLASLSLAAQTLWEWAMSKRPHEEEWTEAEAKAHPAPTPTPPGSPIRRGVIPESVEEMKEVKRSEPASTRAGGAIASVR